MAITFDGSGSRDPDGTVAAYWWQFGDGSSTTVGTPTVAKVYAAPGTYTATLWVRDALGLWSATSDSATATISAATTTTTSGTPTTTTSTLPNQPPVANAGPDQFTQTLTTVNLNGSGSDPDGTIALASWAFGDGASAAGLTATHSYATPGTYTATLSVIDDDGSLDTDTATITVANRPPNAEAGPNTGGAPGAMIGLNGSASTDPDGTIVGWTWAFGDGTTGSGATPSHAYTNPGTYTATLTVTDNNGANAADSTSVVVASSSAPWARALGSTGSDGSYAVAVDASGNTVVSGVYRGTVNFGGTQKTSAGGADVFVAKYSSTGALLWVTSAGGTTDDSGEAIAVAANGDVLLAARFSGSASFGGTQPALVANGTSDIAVAKYRGSDGGHLWSKRFGGAWDDSPAGIATDTGGNVYFTGYFRGTVDFGGGLLSVPFTTDLDVFIAKLDGNGNHVWSKNFTNDGNERGYGIAVDGNGNVAITGYFSNTINFGGGPLTSPNAMTDIFVARFTTAGAHSWSKRFGAPDGSESGYAMAMDSTGNVVIAGHVLKVVDLGGGSLAPIGSSDGFVAKYAATSGAHQWSRRIGGMANDYAYGITVDPGTNAVYVTGAFEDVASFGGGSLTATGGSDAFVAKYGATGTPAWTKQLGGLNADVARAIQFRAGMLATSGYFSGAGTFEGVALTAAGAADGFVVRVTP